MHGMHIIPCRFVGVVMAQVDTQLPTIPRYSGLGPVQVHISYLREWDQALWPRKVENVQVLDAESREQFYTKLRKQKRFRTATLTFPSSGDVPGSSTQEPSTLCMKVLSHKHQAKDPAKSQTPRLASNLRSDDKRTQWPPKGRDLNKSTRGPSLTCEATLYSCLAVRGAAQLQTLRARM